MSLASLGSFSQSWDKRIGREGKCFSHVQTFLSLTHYKDSTVELRVLECWHSYSDPLFLEAPTTLHSELSPPALQALSPLDIQAVCAGLQAPVAGVQHLLDFGGFGTLQPLLVQLLHVGTALWGPHGDAGVDPFHLLQ